MNEAPFFGQLTLLQPGPIKGVAVWKTISPLSFVFVT